MLSLYLCPYFASSYQRERKGKDEVQVHVLAVSPLCKEDKDVHGTRGSSAVGSPSVNVLAKGNGIAMTGHGQGDQMLSKRLVLFHSVR